MATDRVAPESAMPARFRSLFAGRLRKAVIMGSNHYDKRGLYSDAQLVECYLKHHSQIKAAAELQVSRETVARAVRRAGVRMDGRKLNGAKQPNEKATDEQIALCAKSMNCSEIAKEYGMSQERVYRRARKLGIKLETKWTGGHWRRRAEHYGCKAFDDSITLTALFHKENGVCAICGKPVDVTDINDGHIGRRYPTLDHVVPLSKGGTHTWDNVQLAHMSCNAGKRDR